MKSHIELEIQIRICFSRKYSAVDCVAVPIVSRLFSVIVRDPFGKVFIAKVERLNNTSQVKGHLRMCSVDWESLYYQ